VAQATGNWAIADDSGLQVTAEWLSSGVLVTAKRTRADFAALEWVTNRTGKLNLSAVAIASRWCDLILQSWGGV